MKVQSLFDSSIAFTSLMDASPPQLWRLKIRSILPITAFRIDFCLDSAFLVERQPWNKADPFKGLSISSLFHDDSGKSAAGYPAFWNLRLFPKGREWELRFLIFNPRLAPGTVVRQIPLGIVKTGVPYCLEVLLSIGSDSLLGKIALRLNGVPSGGADAAAMGCRMSACLWQIGCIWPNYHLRGSACFTRMALASDWPGHPPRRPVIPGRAFSAIRGDTILLRSPAYTPFLVPSVHAMTRYQIALDSNDWSLPLFDSDTTGPGRDSLKVRLRPAGGTKPFWRVRHYSADGNASDWSRPVLLAFDSPAPTAPLLSVTDAFYSLPGDSRPEKTLVPEKWYDLNIRFSFCGDTTGLAYLLFWANTPEYPYGNLANKGGIFLPAASYVYNLSHGEDVLFEKYSPGSYATRMLDTTCGLYCDASNHGYVLDDKKGEARLRVRFLKEAERGPWCLRGVAWNGMYSPSDLFYGRFEIRDQIEPAGRPMALKMAAAVAGFLILCSLLFLGIKRQRAATALLRKRYEKTVQDFTEYLNANLTRTLSPADMEKRMGMGYAVLRNAVKAVTGTGIKNTIIRLRIERAKELLQTTSRNVTEVMFECGFNDLSYFTRTFKKIVGQNPKKFQSGS